MTGNTSPTTPTKSSTPEYRVWRDMQNRCYRKKNKDYERYGGRGITVHRLWRGPGGFDPFMKHVGPRPSPQHSLDRIKNNLGYKPGNVRWAVRTVQMQNTRRTIFVRYKRRRQTLRKWCQELKLPYHMVYNRIYTRGWSVAKALSRAHPGLLPNAKLSYDAVRAMRILRKTNSLRTLAKRFGVAESTVSQACTGATW